MEVRPRPGKAAPGLPAVRQILKGGALVLAGMLFGGGTSYLSKIVIARALGPGEFGLFSLSYSMVFLGASCALLGLPRALARFIPYFGGRGDYGGVKEITVFSFWATIAAGIVLGFLLYFGSGVIAVKFFHTIELARFLRLFAWIVPIAALIQMNSGALRGFKATRYKVLTEDILKGALLMVFLFPSFLIFGRNPEAVIISCFAAFGASAAAGLYCVGKCLCERVGRRRTDGMSGAAGADRAAAMKTVLVFAAPLAISALVNNLVAQTDTLMLGHFAGAPVVGLYGAAALVSQTMGLGLAAVNFLFMPVASEFYAAGKVKESGDLYLALCRRLFYAVLPVFLTLLLFPGPVLVFWFGRAYAGAAGALRLLSLGSFFNVSAGMAGPMTLVMGKSRAYLLFDIIGLAVNIFLCFALIPRLGMAGAAISNAAGIVIWNISALGFVYRRLRLHPFMRKWEARLSS